MDSSMNQPDSYFGLPFPPQLFTYELVPDGIHDYQNEPPCRGLGYSADYEILDVWSRSLTAYIYDLGVPSIPNDLSDEILKNECIRSAREVMSSTAYSEVNVTDNSIFTYRG